MKSHIMLPRLFACTFGPKHMYHIGPFERFLYGHWVDGYKYLGCYITSDFIDDRDLEDQARAIYSRSNMIVRKFSNCSVDFKNQLSRSYISCLYCSALWLIFSTATFNMTRVAYNNVYRALMGITRGYMVIVYLVNSVQITWIGFHAVLKKKILSLRGHLHKSVNIVVASYVSSPYFMLSSPLCAK